jgi:predicted ATPase/DNA-binding SARP family transcriptional activator
MARLALRLLGPPRVEVDGEPVHIGRRKALALLAYLAVTARPHTRDSLATLLWPSYDQAGARGELRRMLSILKRTLGEPCLAVDRAMAGIDADADVWVDVAEFRRLLAECEGHGHGAGEACTSCAGLLEEAAALYEDDFLAGFTLDDSAAFDEWQRFEAEGLRDELGSVLERLARCRSAQGDHEGAIEHARRWVALDALHEPAQRALMQAYAGAGQRSAALRQYGECERVLRSELGLTPSAATVALRERIELGAGERAAEPATAPRARPNLPAQAIPLVGREDVLAEIAEMLRDPSCRLLTLLGPGGSGKTRLAVEAGARQVEAFENGVCFVSLAPVNAVESIVPTVAQGVGCSLQGATDSVERLLDYLERRELLLILDNFEHLIGRPGEEGADGTPLVTRIIEAAPRVTVLVTSRAALRLRHERLFPVAGMAHPAGKVSRAEDAASYSAVQLFVEGARQVRPSFALKPENASSVSSICRLVSGMPLGVLLAASWVRALTAPEIAAELEAGLELLETDLRDVPARQRSMVAVFDHSWGLLAGRERAVMAALSAFRGGFTRPAARAVAGATLGTLRSLVDRSMVQMGRGGRYEVHELLRQYAWQKLKRSPKALTDARERHADYYAGALETWAADLKGSRQVEALAEMDEEIDNARAAWDWCAERVDVERLGQAAEGLYLYHEMRFRHEEGDRACQAAIDALEQQGERAAEAARADEGDLVRHLVLADVLSRQGIHHFGLERPETSRALLERSLSVLERLRMAGLDVRAVEVQVLLYLARWHHVRDNLEGLRLSRQALSLARELGDRWAMASALLLAGWTSMALAEVDTARLAFEEGLAMCRELGDRRLAARMLGGLAWLSRLQGQLEEVERLDEEALAISEEVGDAYGVAYSETQRTYRDCYMRGEYLASRTPMARVMTLCDAIGDRLLRHFSSLNVAYASVHLGDYDRARALARETEHQARARGQLRILTHALQVLGMSALANGEFPHAHRLLAECAALPRDTGRLDALSLYLPYAAYGSLGVGEIATARTELHETLLLLKRFGAASRLWPTLPAAALILADEGDRERAVELYEMALRHATVANSRWFQDVAGKRVEAIAVTLPAEVVAAAKERGRARDEWATIDELIDEFEEGAGSPVSGRTGGASGVAGAGKPTSVVPETSAA